MDTLQTVQDSLGQNWVKSSVMTTEEARKICRLVHKIGGADGTRTRDPRLDRPVF